MFGWPDMKREEMRFKVEVPRLGSMILTHSWNGKIPGWALSVAALGVVSYLLRVFVHAAGLSA